MAEGTTTSWWPCAANRAMRRATSRIRSGLPMEVPPYFWTIRATLEIRQKQLFYLFPPPIPNEEPPPAPEPRPGRPRLGGSGDGFCLVPGRAAGGGPGALRVLPERADRGQRHRAAHPALRGPPPRPGRAREPRAQPHARALQGIRGRARARLPP